MFGRWEPDNKAKNNLPNWTLCDIFETTNLNYNLRSQTDFTRILVNTSSFGLNSLKCLATKIWDIVPYHVKSVENLNSFIKKIRNWEPTGCHCWLCKQHVDFRTLGYVDTSYYNFFYNYFYFLRCKWSYYFLNMTCKKTLFLFLRIKV